MADLKKIQVDGQLYDINVPDGKIGTDQLKDGRVALAENLVGRGSVPAEYTFRTAGGDADLGSGSALIKMLKGRTLVFNQILRTASITATSGGGVALTKDGNKIVLNGLCTEAYDFSFSGVKSNFIVGHKYALIHRGSSKVRAAVHANGTFPQFQANATVFLTISSLNTNAFYIEAVNGENYSNDFVYINIVDLTLMFGAGNEPSTPEEFEALFPLDYYAYNAGQLLSVTATGIETVGFNAYNPETGKAILLGGHKYQVSGTYTALDFNGAAPTLDGEGCFTPSENGELTVTGGNNTDTCVHLVWSGYRNGEYEPYWSETRNLPITTLTGKKDGAGESVVIFGDGFKSAGSAFDEITANGAVKRIGKVDLGTLDWAAFPDYNTYSIIAPFVTGMKRPSANEAAANCLSSIYVVVPASAMFRATTPLGIAVATGGAVIVSNSAYNTADATSRSNFIASLSGVYLYYELDTPETYVLDEPLTLTYKVDDFGTEKELPQNDDEPATAPIRYEVQYAMNAVDTLRRLPVNYISKESMEAFLAELDSTLGAALSATVETTMTWDADNEKYAFSMSVTPNTEPEP